MYSSLKDFARYNRNHPTEAESLLWNYLKDSALGVSFKRQHIIGEYIVDFFCLEYKLIVEIDGGYHQLSGQQASDAQRAAWLEGRGYRVIRFTNDELFKDIGHVLNNIENNMYE